MIARLGPRRNTSPWNAASWLLALGVLALVIPASDKIASNTVFLEAHGVSAVTWIVLLLLGLVVAWLALGGLTALVRRVASPRWFDIIVSIVTFVVAWFLVGNVLSRVVFSQVPWLGPIVGIIVAAVVTWLARRYRAGNVLFVFASLAAVVPLAVTAWSSSQEPPPAAFSFDTSANRPDIVWVLSDELQAPLVLDPQGQVRPEFPNLRALQEQSTTYTHVYATANYTDYAVPAQLTGVADVAAVPFGVMQQIRAGLGILPGLSEKYQIVTESPLYEFECKDASCASISSNPRESAIARYWGFAKDTLAIAGRSALAEPFASYFPSLDGKWRDFWSGGDEFGDNANGDTVGRAMTQIDEAVAANPQAPLFAFWHTIRTHAPWPVDREGNLMYPARLPIVQGAHMVGSDKKGRYSTADLEYMERRLYANAAVDFDRQLGQLIDHLKKIGRYDNTMIIVDADHGAAMTTTLDRRYGDTLEQRWAEVAHVPLIIKSPGQTTPEVVAEPKSAGQIAATVMQTAGATAGPDLTLAPDLSRSVPGPVFSTVTVADATGWTYAGAPEPDPWRAEDLTPPDPAHPFAIGIDLALLEQPVPAGYTRMQARVDALPTNSNQQLLVLTRNPGACSDPEAPSLIVSQDRVIGSGLWEKDTQFGSTAARGWAIVPKADPVDYSVWCRAS